MLKFGDVIYRPWLDYEGKKEFISTHIVLGVVEKDDVEYISSVDFVGRKWLDELYDLGNTIFVDKNEALDKLYRMIRKVNLGV